MKYGTKLHFQNCRNFFWPSPADFSPCIGRFVNKLIHWPPSCGHFENDSGHNIGLNDSLLVFMSLENVSDCSFYQINLKFGHLESEYGRHIGSNDKLLVFMSLNMSAIIPFTKTI